jgi:hypothetical protein
MTTRCILRVIYTKNAWARKMLTKLILLPRSENFDHLYIYWVGVWVACSRNKNWKANHRPVYINILRTTKYLNKASSWTMIGTQFLSIFSWSSQMPLTTGKRCRAPLGERAKEIWYQVPCCANLQTRKR